MAFDRNDGLGNELIELIRSVSMKTFRKLISNYPRDWVAKVIETSPNVSQNGIVQVYLNGDSSSTPISLKSKSNEVLQANDEVYIHSPSGSLSDAIVLWKK